MRVAAPNEKEISHGQGRWQVLERRLQQGHRLGPSQRLQEKSSHLRVGLSHARN
jgi:hypothetical protein